MSDSSPKPPETVAPSSDPGARYAVSALFRPPALASLALIGAIVLAVLGGFAYVAGWLTPSRLTQGKIIARFESGGIHSGFRRNHAKGVCVAGFFVSNGKGAALSKAQVFEAGRRTAVFGRFALAGPNPFMADGPKAVRSMALNFSLADGEVWRTGINDIPVFPVTSARGFYELLAASAPDPKTGKPDPAKMKAFFAANPESAKAIARIKSKPFSSGFANATYNSLDAFRFVNAAGISTSVRWSMVAQDPFKPDRPTPEQLKNKNYLFDALHARMQQGPIKWHLVITVGQKGDSTKDPTIPWPEDREHLDIGTLTLKTIADEEHGGCRDINFDPLVLPAGIEPSDDPILSARSAAYARSFQHREAEKKIPSAVQFPTAEAANHD